MAVVVSEFEVVPAEPAAAARPEPAGDTERTPRKPRDEQRELERMLRTRRMRALRLMAV